MSYDAVVLFEWTWLISWRHWKKVFAEPKKGTLMKFVRFLIQAWDLARWWRESQIQVAAIKVSNFMLVSKHAQFAWNFELCRLTILHDDVLILVIQLVLVIQLFEKIKLYTESAVNLYLVLLTVWRSAVFLETVPLKLNKQLFKLPRENTNYEWFTCN